MVYKKCSDVKYALFECFGLIDSGNECPLRMNLDKILHTIMTFQRRIAQNDSHGSFSFANLPFLVSMSDVASVE